MSRLDLSLDEIAGERRERRREDERRRAAERRRDRTDPDQRSRDRSQGGRREAQARRGVSLRGDDGGGGHRRIPDDRPYDDPRGRVRQTKTTNGRNSDSFDPRSTLVRPHMRVRVGDPRKSRLAKEMTHDDIWIVPGFFCDESDFRMYHELVDAMRDIQKTNAKAEWISWHEGCHLITKSPGGALFDKIVRDVCEYFHIRPSSASTRFNWYVDAQDWKAFHHDSAAFNEQRARQQNITVGVSFGDEREVGFRRAEHADGADPTAAYFPMPNGSMYAFGRDVNIRWKHGVNAVPKEKQSGAMGRVSIIIWGFCEAAIDEEGSPPMVVTERPGPKSSHGTSGMPPCRDFGRGACRYGERCRFTHGNERHAEDATKDKAAQQPVNGKGRPPSKRDGEAPNKPHEHAPTSETGESEEKENMAQPASVQANGQ